MSMTVYENGVFHKMQSNEPATLSGIVVEDEVIHFAGTVGECQDFAGTRRHSVDLAGAHVIPGFTDGHIHTAQLALQSSELDLSSADSLFETLAIVADRIESPTVTVPASAWLFGGRWNNRAWKDQAMPTRQQLDAVTGDTPTALHHSDLHTFWLNSAALREMGIGRQTPDSVGGTISRDGSGEPTGILGEAAAFAAERYFAAETRTTLDNTIGDTLARLLSYGVTSIHDIDGEDALRAFSALHEVGKLPLRVHKLMPVAMLDELIERGIVSGAGDRWLNYGAVKIFGDGSLSSHTCLLHGAYRGEPNNHGIAVTPPELLGELVQRANDNGLSAAIHAIGDRAVSNAITALEQTERRGSRSSLPNRIEHLQHIDPVDIVRFGALSAVACMQPASCTSDIEMVDDLLAQHTVRSYAWRSVLDAGGAIAFSSDAPVESTNPFTGIHAAVTRQRADATPVAGWIPQERITRSEAFAAYMQGPAKASGESTTKGSLSVGRLADFAILDRDPSTVDDLAILNTTVTHTVVGGAVAWSL